MKKERKTYAEVESRYPKLTNRFEILDVDEEYPELETGANESSTGETNTEAINDLKKLFQWLELQEGEIIVGADVNAHHASWSPEYPECQRGRTFHSLVTDSNLIMLNDGSATMNSPPGTRESAIDVTLATAGVVKKVTWEVVPEEFGSAHLTISLEMGKENPVVYGTSKKINKDKAIRLLNANRPQYIYDPEEMQDIFDEALEEASYVISNKKNNYLKKFWNKDIDDLYNTKREALRMYNRDRSRTNFIELQRRRAMFKKALRKENRAYVKELKEKIDENSPARQLWNIVKGVDTGLSGGKKKVIVASRELGRELMDYFFPNTPSEVFCPTASTAKYLEGFENALKDYEILQYNHKKKKKKNAIYI
ncbi:uncharacterized protein LOC135717590 [Ochlerotatus camptorhynchus]|uniref:uncharacterized protein LOC135717590 n=1 Tax=Ochlerotatus camptorhynchus TaxID=644619 RepID=UPI0031D26988